VGRGGGVAEGESPFAAAHVNPSSKTAAPVFRKLFDQKPEASIGFSLNAKGIVDYFF